MPSPRHARVRFDAPDFAAIEATRAKYKDVELSPRTLNSYAADWRVFEAWTEAAKRAPIPASEETVEFYCTDLLRLGRKISTVERHCFAIQHMHTRAGFESPYGEQVKRLLSGARRLLAQMPTQKAALETADLKRIVRKLGHKTPTAARNSALLLFGFASALRRSTLAELRPEDLKFTREGVLVTVRHEKQDRKGDGRLVAVPVGQHATTCPVQALDRWLDGRGRKLPGALFCRVLNGKPDGKQMLGNRIAQIVQDSVALIGLDRKEYGAHSMRAGCVSEALAGGADALLVARQTGHASLDTLRLYERSRDLFRGNAAGMIGL